MAGEWQECLLEDLAAPVRNAIVGGPFGSDLVQTDYVSVGVPVIRGENLAAGRWVTGDFVFVSEQKADLLRANTATAGDVVFTQRGANHYRQIAMVPDGCHARYVISQSQMKVTLDRAKVDPRFVYYWFRDEAQQDYLQRNAIATGVPHTNLGILRQVPIRVPPLTTQHAIADVLSGLDDKIDLNRRMNETLEAMARALFKSWFVDFDPVRAKAEGRQPAGIDAETAKLFPTEFVDSELGPTPKGWRATTVGIEVARCGGRIQTGPFGSQLHASDYVPDGVPVVMPKDIVGRRVSGASIARIPESDADRLSRHRLEDGDVVYSRRGDVERHALISAREVGWLCGTGCLLVRLGPGWPSPAFASFAFDSPETRAWIVQHAIGATMPNLNTGILSDVPLVMPPEGVLVAFSRLVDPLLRLAESRADESSVLAVARDELLPYLLSGELPPADRIIAESA